MLKIISRSALVLFASSRIIRDHYNTIARSHTFNTSGTFHVLEIVRGLKYYNRHAIMRNIQTRITILYPGDILQYILDNDFWLQFILAARLFWQEEKIEVILHGQTVLIFLWKYIFVDWISLSRPRSISYWCWQNFAS